jgi:hypothetical protein
MASLGVIDRDHPFFGDPAGDPLPPVSAVTALAGSRSCPATNTAAPRPKRPAHPIPALQRRHEHVRVIHQRRNQRILRRPITSVDLRLARPGVIMTGAHRRDLLRRPGHHPARPTDRGDQLSDCALDGRQRDSGYVPGAGWPVTVGQ